MHKHNTGPLALLLQGHPGSSDSSNLQAMLDFFEVPWLAAGSEEIPDADRLLEEHSQFAVLVPAETLAALLQPGNGALASLLGRAASVYVYGWKANHACRALLREMTGDADADIQVMPAQPLTVTFTDDFEQLCGPLSGLEIGLSPGAAETVLNMRPAGGEFQALASSREGCLFASLVYRGTRVFVDSSPAILDIQQPVTTNFDVRKSFAGAVATVLYLRWAFREIWWHAPELNACLILDDLLLKERHGYFCLTQLLRILDQHGMAATIAFIPWNWRRRESRAVETVRRNAGRLSLCMHGCDHSQSEFSLRSVGWLDAKIRTGKRRMRRLFAEAGIPCDRVQVFPRGKFCPEVGRALRHNGLLAAVNTHVVPYDQALNCTTVADHWRVANLRYGGFPIFSRRDIGDSVENFAFDGILGKPALIVGHHDLFHDGGAKLVQFVERLHSLKWKLEWRTLGNALCRSYTARQAGEVTRVKMYAEQLVLENLAGEARKYAVVKQAGETQELKQIVSDGQPCVYGRGQGGIEFAVELPPQGLTRIKCEYAGKKLSRRLQDPLSYRVKVALERRLAVLRDDWMRAPGVLQRSAMAALRLRAALEARKRRAMGKVTQL